MNRASFYRRLSFLLAGIIFLISGWQRDGPLWPIVTLIVAGVVIVIGLLVQQRQVPREPE